MDSNSSGRREASPLFSNSVISLHLKELGYPEKSINSMLRCGEVSGYKFVKNCKCKTKIVISSYHCSLRTCPRCSKIRKRRMVSRYLPFLKGLYQDRKNFLYFLTISPKNYEDLEKGLSHIKESFSKFLRHIYINDRIKGGLYVIEVKGTEGDWNIHIHAIIYGRYIDNKVRKNKNSKIVDLFRQSSGREVNIHVSKQDTTEFSLNYMCKYISANEDDFKTEKDIAKYIMATRKKRLINAFGDFRGVKVKNVKPKCYDCDEEVEYINDYEIVHAIEECRAKPKPPKDLRDY